jgi:hypothetical protein
LIVLGIWSLLLFGFSLLLACNAWRFYVFTLPFIITSGALVGLAATGIIVHRTRTAMFWIAIPLHGLLFLPFYFAMSRWPGGDDGPGLAWMVFVGGGSCIAGALAIILTVIGIVLTARKIKETEPTDALDKK